MSIIGFIKANLSLTKKQSILLLLIPLVLSGYTHLYNPVGFPDIFFDEGVYMRRAMNVLEGNGPQESYFYDHPYFGQLFLSGAMFLAGFPNSLQPEPEASSIASLYMIPRIFMGFLAIIDTFLIYKIAKKQYGFTTGIVASTLFAVMPITWMLRMILLDSLLLPFLLLSVLFALNSKDSKNKTLIILLSGISLGLAIFTKVPIVTMIPLVGFFVFSTNKSWKHVGLWFLPVILIPLIWPAYSISIDQFDLWMKDVLWQSGRSGGGILHLSDQFLLIDPLLFVLGIGSFVYAGIRKDKFVLLWLIPFLVYFSFIGYTQYFHWIPILPIFCIATAVLLKKLSVKFKEKLKTIPYVFVLAVLVFGFTSTTMLITTDLSSAQFEAIAFVLQNISNEDDLTILSSPVYSWILSDVFNVNGALPDYSVVLFEPITTKKILVISDIHFLVDFERGKQIQEVYEKTKTVKQFEGNVANYDIFQYPYTSMKITHEASNVEIRTNFS